MPDSKCDVICERADDVVRWIGKDCVDLVITSPPYWNILSKKRSADRKTVVDYITGDGNLSEIDDYYLFLEELEKIFKQIFQTMKNDRWLCLNVMDIRVKNKIYLLHSDIVSCLQNVGFNFEDLIIWNRQQEYNNLRPLGYPTVFRVNKVHEYILLFRKLTR